jgi:hypothetical protein
LKNRRGLLSPRPAQLDADPGPPAVTAPPSLTDGARLSALFPQIPPSSARPRDDAGRITAYESATRHHLTPQGCLRVRLPLEPSHRLQCAVESHHRCPPASALVSAAPVGFRGRPLGDEVLEQAAPLAKLPLPNAYRGGHRLVLPTRTRSHVGRVRWHLPSCHVARLNSDAPSTSPPPTAKGQRHAHVASMRVHRSSCSLRRLCPRACTRC